MNPELALLKVYCSNYVAYNIAHSSHINIEGRTFYSDHKLLQKIYEDLQDEIDTLGELIRSADQYVPKTLAEVILGSSIPDAPIIDDHDGDELLSGVQTALEELIQNYVELEKVSTDYQYNHLANYAADRVRTIHKFVWMLKSTLVNRF